MDLAGNLLGTEVLGGEIGRREEQIGVGIDRAAIFLFGPGEQGVVRPKARFDMSNRSICDESSKRGAEGARRVALDDDQVRRISQQRQKRGCNRANMRVRILLSRTTELHVREPGQAELPRFKSRMLAGEDQSRRNAALGERESDGLQLDGFRPGADDQPYVRKTQRSP